MKKYIKLFIHLIFARSSSEFNMRMNLVTQHIGSLIFFFLHIFSFGLILNKFSFPGWTRGELWAFLFTFEIFSYAAFFIFWKGQSRTVEDINSGGFDIVLVKPVNSRFLTFIRSGGLHNLSAIILGIISLASCILKFNLSVTPTSLILYSIFLILGLWIIHSLSVALISLNFKYGYLQGTAFAIYETQESFKYPGNIYLQGSSLIKILVLPMSLLTTIPTTYLLLKPVNFELISTFIVFLIFSTLVSHFSWKTGLANYSSASS